MTVPAQPGFTAPESHPPVHPATDLVWYGTADLWTALAVDGTHTPRKSVWWSANFPGGTVEERPPLTVTYRRLDTAAQEIVEHDATNAHTVEEGWFMIAGIDPDIPGCWEVTAEYKGATLSYVFEVF